MTDAVETVKASNKKYKSGVSRPQQLCVIVIRCNMMFQEQKSMCYLAKPAMSNLL